MIKPNMNIFTNINANTVKDTEVRDNLDLSLDDAFKQLKQEQLKNLTKLLEGYFYMKVFPLCVKLVHLEHGSFLELPYETLDKILVDMVTTGEEEPYGVMGGTLVVNYVHRNSGKLTKRTQIGIFPLKPDITTTFELHLTLYPSTDVKYKIANLIEKIQGKSNKLVIDQKFMLCKKKRYR